MGTVSSRDGTSIAYQRQGDGPAVILVGGGLDDGTENAPLAGALAARFTVFNYARRGRGGSGDTAPYAVEREVEDIAALIGAAGGAANLYGVSSGGMLGLEAAMAGLPIERLAVYDVPYDTAADAKQRYDEYRERLGAALAVGRHGEAVQLFMGLAGSPPQEIAAARELPFWPDLEGLAPTLAYDAALYGSPPKDRLATIAQPTLVATGAASAGRRTGEPYEGFFAAAAEAIAAAVPSAERVTLAGAGHSVDPQAMASELDRFFGESEPRPRAA